MKYDQEGRRTLSELYVRADRTLAGVEGLLDLGPLDAEGAAASDLAAQLAARLQSMPEDQRRATMVKTAVALADLGELCQELSEGMAEVGGEIRRVSSHSNVSAAYRRGRAAVNSSLR